MTSRLPPLHQSVLWQDRPIWRQAPESQGAPWNGARADDDIARLQTMRFGQVTDKIRSALAGGSRGLGRRHGSKGVEINDPRAQAKHAIRLAEKAMTRLYPGLTG
jgi:hypothetical protein